MARRLQPSPLHPVPCEAPACAEPIFFAATGPGRSIPLDAEPDPAGNTAAYCNASGTWVARVLHRGEQAASHEKTYMPHWKTCKDPDAFRRRRELAAARRQLAARRRKATAAQSDPQPTLFGP
jgi:hypothetical protein